MLRSPCPLTLVAAAFAATLAQAQMTTAEEWPAQKWMTATADDAGLDEALLKQGRDYALTGGGSGFITRGGRLVLSWGDVTKRYDLKSSTKSFGATSLGVAILDGKLALADRAIQRHPGLGVPPESNTTTGWLGRITLQHLATHTAGFEKPGGYTALTFEPGTKWSYSDGGPNWLAECVTLAYRRDVRELMFERIFTPLGITPSDLTWRDNGYRPKTLDGIPRREFGSGISANVDAMARVGLLYLRGGLWNGRRLLPEAFVAQAGTNVPGVPGLPVVDPKSYGNASDHYGLLWWNNADGTIEDLPRDAYWSWGLYDSLIVVIPSLDLVVSRAGQSWKRSASGHHYDPLRPFLEPIAAAVKRPAARPRAGAVPSASRSAPVAWPIPRSTLIREIQWAPAESIVRRARGSDNWPLTWADDDRLYTAYGDGRGFEPLLDTKLSMGLARIAGPAGGFRAENLRSPSLEARGDGARGKKASGLLMVDGTLYLWARNAGNAQLAWSSDHGVNWTWSDWKLTESFGCPTFLNFGRNYEGSRDAFVYIYSHDNASAYEPADRMVLARVPAASIRDRAAYAFFAGLDASRQPTWSADVSRRAAVFSNPGRCYRSSVSYNALLRRYLCCQILPGGDPRFAGGLAIHDAPEPWGPWTTAFVADPWDVGPGETASIPTKWIEDDGRTFHIVFSGDDQFSVRQGRLILAR